MGTTARLATNNPFIEFVETYKDDPVALVKEVFGVTPDEWQADVLRAYARHDRRISIRSAHGVGKTAVVAWIALHHQLCRYPQKTAVTAPSSPQLFDAFFSEMLYWLRKLPKALQPLFNQKSDRVELVAATESSFITARTSRADQPEALQGIHSEWVLLIVDEASGVPEQVFEAASGSMSGHNATTLLIGNPVRTTGLFYATHTRLKAEWTTFHVSAFDSPRVSKEFIAEMRRRYGEYSNVYRVRVLGEFPKVDDDTIIPFDLVEEAQNRHIEVNPDAPIVWGLDVARFGSDRSALCKRQRNVVSDVTKVWRNYDLMRLSGAIKNEWDECSESTRPHEILVDAIGVGAGVCDRLRELGLPVRGINVAETAAMKDQYRNLRSELWFLAKDWFMKRDCKIPPEDIDLATELVASKYKYASSGKLQVETKDDIRKRLQQSPDMADAFVLTFASDAATITHGYGGSHWNQPIKRNVKGLV